MQTLRYTIGLILGIALPYAAQRWDRRRLAPERRAAAWNGATWGASLYAFGPLSMLGWAWVTRARFSTWRRRDGAVLAVLWSAALLLAGLAAAVAIFAVIVGVDWLVGTQSGAPD